MRWEMAELKDHQQQEMEVAEGAAASLVSDIDGPGSGSMLEPAARSHL